jgi:hypothetical protein
MSRFAQVSRDLMIQRTKLSVCSVSLFKKTLRNAWLFSIVWTFESLSKMLRCRTLHTMSPTEHNANTQAVQQSTLWIHEYTDAQNSRYLTYTRLVTKDPGWQKGWTKWCDRQEPEGKYREVATHSLRLCQATCQLFSQLVIAQLCIFSKKRLLRESKGQTNALKMFDLTQAVIIYVRQNVLKANLSSQMELTTFSSDERVQTSRRSEDPRRLPPWKQKSSAWTEMTVKNDGNRHHQASLRRGATVNTRSRRRQSTKNTLYPPLDDAVLRTRNVEGMAILEGPHPNFFRLVSGYIDADFCNQIFIFQRFEDLHNCLDRTTVLQIFAQFYWSFTILSHFSLVSRIFAILL